MKCPTPFTEKASFLTPAFTDSVNVTSGEADGSLATLKPFGKVSKWKGKEYFKASGITPSSSSPWFTNRDLENWDTSWPGFRMKVDGFTFEDNMEF
jgi:hypothetical protein